MARLRQRTAADMHGLSPPAIQQAYLRYVEHLAVFADSLVALGPGNVGLICNRTHGV